MTYFCEGTIVKANNGYDGKIISVDRDNQIAVVEAGKTSYTEKFENLTFVSYREVK